MITGASPALLPFQPGCAPFTGLRAAALKFNHPKTVFYLHSAFHPKNPEDLVDILVCIITSPPEKGYRPPTGRGTNAGKQVPCVPW